MKGRQLVGSQEIEMDDTDEGGRNDGMEVAEMSGDEGGLRSNSDDEDGEVNNRDTDSDEDESGSDVDSARERANASKLTIDTKKSAEPDREIGD